MLVFMSSLRIYARLKAILYGLQKAYASQEMRSFEFTVSPVKLDYAKAVLVFTT